MRVRKISNLNQDLVDIIGKISDIINIKKIKHLVVFGTDEIDCFLGGLHCVLIKGLREGAKVNIRVLIKWHSNPIDRIHFRSAYQRECVFYRHIVPRLVELQQSYEIIEGLKIKFPNCILADTEDNEEKIVLHFNNDFKLLSRYCKLDFSHSSIVLKNLAKLHGLSFVLQKTSPNDFEYIRNLCDKDVQYADPDNIPELLFDYFKESLEIVDNREIKAKLEEISPHILELLSKSTAPVRNYSTICHADCWNNNLLFKYQVNDINYMLYLSANKYSHISFPTFKNTGKRPVDVIFVDYQLVRYASPVTDISYFLYMSTDQEILCNHYDQLLNIYYGTLSAVLRQCSLEVSDIYPKEIFQKHLREYSVLGLIETLISMKIITADTDEALKMTKMKYYLSEPSGYSGCNTKNQAFYVERINGVVNEFFNRGYSLDALLCQ
ncbi:uncharacterized protein LOC123656606 [Melitaea cinxia]|uniref:uncharacterized protein LOC123656606 n=1 Tax=Melitaea cinxia TaxID=113334 RepID=UPI001E273E33|nr:uncharacterized protein LOC123656606 [Melitaea cinxia]